jgi:hypothetical protein
LFRGWDPLDLDRLIGFREGFRVKQSEGILSIKMDVVAKIRQATRRKNTAKEKIRIVLEGEVI